MAPSTRQAVRRMKRSRLLSHSILVYKDDLAEVSEVVVWNCSSCFPFCSSAVPSAAFVALQSGQLFLLNLTVLTAEGSTGESLAPC